MKKNNKKQTIAALAILIVAAFLLLFRSCNKKVDTNETLIEPAINEVVEVPNNITEEVVVEEVDTTEVKDNTTLSYWVNFLNKDGSVLQRTVYKYGETPSYNGSTPTYTDYAYYYSFKGWDKQTSPVKGTQTYTALYDIVGEVVSSKTTTSDSTPTVTPSYLTFTAEQANSIIRLNKHEKTTNSLSASIQYKRKNDDSWTTYNYGAGNYHNTFGYYEYDGDPILLTNVGDFVQFRANPDSVNSSFSINSSNYYFFEMSGSISASGDVTSLLNGVGGDITLPFCCFSCLFIECSSLTTPPRLPSTTLGFGCYYAMFGNCTNLTSAPKLPATTLVSGCYYRMFNNCTSLKIANTTDMTVIDDDNIIFTIPSDFSNSNDEATNMFSGCYSNGFQGTPSAIGAPPVDTIYYWYTSD